MKYMNPAVCCCESPSFCSDWPVYSGTVTIIRFINSKSWLNFSLQDLLNFEDPLNIEAAEMYNKNKSEFQCKVTEYIAKNKRWNLWNILFSSINTIILLLDKVNSIPHFSLLRQLGTAFHQLVFLYILDTFTSTIAYFTVYYLFPKVDQHNVNNSLNLP